MTELSLFKNDPLTRLVTRVGKVRGGVSPLAFLCLLAVVAGYVIPLTLSSLEGLALGPTRAQSFLFDVNFPMQVIAMCILFAAEGLIDSGVEKVGLLLDNNNIVRDEGVLLRAAERLRWMRKSEAAEGVVVALAVVFTLTWVFSGIASGRATWQFQPGHAGSLRPTLAGWWVIITFGPMLQYVLVRWEWKYLMWVVFLASIARSRLRIYVGHPDKAGGLSFLGDLQGRFGYVIFAFGLLVVANDFVIYYIRDSKVLQADVLASTVGFVFGAPVLFLLPLLFFTKKLLMAKHAALASYHVTLTRLVGAMEKKYLGASEENLDGMLDDFSGFAETQSLYENLRGMRVYPFNLGTVRQLLASSIVPILPLLIQFVPWEPARALLKAFSG